MLLEVTADRQKTKSAEVPICGKVCNSSQVVFMRVMVVLIEPFHRQVLEL